MTLGHAKSKTYLSHETSSTVLKDNELKRLVKVAVAAITVPAGTTQLITSVGCQVIKTDNK